MEIPWGEASLCEVFSEHDENIKSAYKIHDLGITLSKPEKEVPDWAM